MSKKIDKYSRLYGRPEQVKWESLDRPQTKREKEIVESFLKAYDEIEKRKSQKKK